MNDFEAEYKFFSSSKGAEEILHLEGPLRISEEKNERFWQDLEYRMKRFIHTQNLSFKDPEKGKYAEDYEGIVRGVLHLANYILERESQENPVSSLFFLDKSARPGAYFLRSLWKELQKKGVITINLPPFFFMNIGQGDEHKHRRPYTNSLVAEAFGQRLKDGIVVVDEFIESGTSVRHALRTLETLYNVQAIALAQNQFLPGWYGMEGVTGVDDAPLSPQVYAALESLTPDQFQILRGLVKTYDQKPKEFERFYFRTGNEGIGFFNILQKTEAPTEIEEIIRMLKRKRILSISVYRYFHTYGGFLSEANSKDNRTFKRHRAILSHLAQEIAPFITNT